MKIWQRLSAAVSAFRSTDGESSADDGDSGQSTFEGANGHCVTLYAHLQGWLARCVCGWERDVNINTYPQQPLKYAQRLASDHAKRAAPMSRIKDDAKRAERIALEQLNRETSALTRFADAHPVWSLAIILGILGLLVWLLLSFMP